METQECIYEEINKLLSSIESPTAEKGEINFKIAKVNMLQSKLHILYSRENNDTIKEIYKINRILAIKSNISSNITIFLSILTIILSIVAIFK